MKPNISAKANKFKRLISPVRQIMSYADPNYIKNIGINPEDLISFAGGWVNHQAPRGLQKAYEEIAANDDLFHRSGSYPPTLGNLNFKMGVIEFPKGHCRCLLRTPHTIRGHTIRALKSKSAEAPATSHY